MASVKIASQIERNPRAPNLNSIALSTIKSNAAASNESLVPSISNKRKYCFTNAFLGSVKIRFKLFASKGSKYVKDGKRPINSGIKPNVFISVGLMYFKKLSPSIRTVSLEVKPIV